VNVDPADPARYFAPSCRSGGTGRRAAFRAQWAQARAGSSPAFGTVSTLLVVFAVLSAFSVLSKTQAVDPTEVVAYPLLRIPDVSRETPSSAARKQSVARNPKATHDYHVLETWETGIVLTGTEVKSLRSGKASIKEAYARLKNGEVFLEGMNITPYAQGNRYNHDPVRTRKLLLHRREIERMIGAVEQRGLTLVPLELYFKNGRAKVALALGKGKKQHDKRETIKRRVEEREAARAVSIRGRR
jgi:SsrA-binding protein